MPAGAGTDFSKKPHIARKTLSLNNHPNFLAGGSGQFFPPAYAAVNASHSFWQTWWLCGSVTHPLIILKFHLIMPESIEFSRCKGLPGHQIYPLSIIVARIEIRRPGFAGFGVGVPISINGDFVQSKTKFTEKVLRAPNVLSKSLLGF